VGVVAVLQFGVLKQYQLDRLGAFLDPKGDTHRAAYNQHQSKIAVSSGGFTGRGLFKGTQTNLSFVPEQHTDFIFTAIGEELGFAGAALLLALFALLVWRTWRTALLARDDVGTLLCVGVLLMLVFQIFVNVGMRTVRSPVHHPGKVSWLLLYPDAYEVGLPNQGLQILYEILNERDDSVAERSYSPWVDLEALLRRERVPLFSVDTHRPAGDFDIL